VRSAVKVTLCARIPEQNMASTLRRSVANIMEAEERRSRQEEQQETVMIALDYENADEPGNDTWGPAAKCRCADTRL
jgi:hypothetical protein